MSSSALRAATTVAAASRSAAADAARSAAHTACQGSGAPAGTSIVSGTATLAAWATWATRRFTRSAATVTSAAVARRRSASQSSTARNLSVPNSFCSSRALASASACRNCANWPCGRSTTWKNCSADMPIRSAISVSASPMRVDLTSQSPAGVSSASSTDACSLVTPVPDFFGRSCSGLRVIRSRRPPIVASSSTSVRTPAGAWSDLSLRVLPRSPGTRP